VGNQRFIAAKASQMSRQEWNDVVLKAEEGTFFHSYDWSKVLTDYGTREERYEPRHIFIRNHETSELVGILPLLFTAKHRLVSLPYGDYGGPCISPNVNRAEVLEVIFNEVERIAQKEAKIIFIKSPPQDYLQWLSLHGYIKTPENYTFILPTQRETLDSLWEKFHRGPKQCVRRAKKKGIAVEEAFQQDLIKEYYGIYVENMKRLGASIRPISFFETLWNLLAERRLMKLFLATYQGEYIAGVIAFPWKNTLHLYANASLEEFRDSGSNYIVCYAAVEWAFRNKFDVDFGLSPLDKNSGLYQFKERWGGASKLLFSASKNYMGATDRLSMWALKNVLSKHLPRRVKKLVRALRS